MSVKEAVQFTGYGKSVIYDAMEDGSLPYVQPAGARSFRANASSIGSPIAS